ncbi:MAG: tRNA (adenosine(37)-N6)-dimethylallyltransferase MiaA [Gammaproteobacteria bacterium]|nr:tRNA (adenosine(37)-N6)-dimethylallyltransferase MiaA [Gammaproteobacteria bacterium]
MGPTASGKTDLALALCDCLPLEIISVDSALVYRGMDIGTAKPSIELRAQYPHHLVDILDPRESYSVATFRRDALRIMADITRRERVPFLVGGTMLYYRALQQGLAILPDAQPELRKQLEKRWREQGLEVLHKELAERDPVAAKRIHRNDPQRILRALEVALATGKAMTEHWAQQTEDKLRYRVFKLALWPQDRAVLHQRIAQRFDQMLATGFIDEVTGLKKRGDLTENMPSIRSVGYRQVWKYLSGELDYEQMRERGVIATRQLAKRQLTWLRSEAEVELLDMLNYPLVQVSERVRLFIG